MLLKNLKSVKQQKVKYIVIIIIIKVLPLVVVDQNFAEVDDQSLAVMNDQSLAEQFGLEQQLIKKNEIIAKLSQANYEKEIQIKQLLEEKDQLTQDNQCKDQRIDTMYGQIQELEQLNKDLQDGNEKQQLQIEMLLQENKSVLEQFSDSRKALNEFLTNGQGTKEDKKKAQEQFNILEQSIANITKIDVEQVIQIKKNEVIKKKIQILKPQIVQPQQIAPQQRPKIQVLQHTPPTSAVPNSNQIQNQINPNPNNQMNPQAIKKSIIRVMPMPADQKATNQPGVYVTGQNHNQTQQVNNNLNLFPNQIQNPSQQQPVSTQQPYNPQQFNNQPQSQASQFTINPSAFNEIQFPGMSPDFIAQNPTKQQVDQLASGFGQRLPFPFYQPQHGVNRTFDNRFQNPNQQA